MYAESNYAYEHNRGLGIVPLTTAATAAATSGSTGVVGGVLGAFGLTNPISAVVLGVTTAIGLWLNRKRPKQKVATTQIVNEAEPFLVQNLQAWNSSAKTYADQSSALANFDAIWGEVVRACGDPTMGDPGRWCIDDRKPGGKWDWFARYRDPIADDPNVVPNASGTEGIAASLLPSEIAQLLPSGQGGMFLLLGGALLLGGIIYYGSSS